MISWKYVVLFSLFAARLVRQPTVPVRVSGGLLQGEIAADGSHVAYYGVPYAKVPLERRFKAAVPDPKWDGVFQAQNEHIRCTQRFTNNLILGTEDCLTLNIYTPLINPLEAPKTYPVMVYIHGGGFRDGSGTPMLYGPEYFIKHGVILVSFNYRLEVLGFLCLGTKDAPGNVGLKDQVEALKWVKRNIKKFNGDPENVSLFGESAGSASAVYHLISPMSDKLFQRVILQSGSAISPWSFQFEPIKTAVLLAKQMGHKTEEPGELFKIFMRKSAQALMKARVPRNEGDIVLSENIFVPCVEKQLDGVTPFLTENPYDLLSQGRYRKVPIIMGYNNAEGYMFVGKENTTTISKIDIYKAVPRDLIFPNKSDKINTAVNLKKLYKIDNSMTREDLVELARFEGDSGITFPVKATAELFLKTNKSPVYIYELRYDGWLNIPKWFFGFRESPGATHADDLFYMFKVKIPLPQALLEQKIINQITTMWTNFAKYGDPTPEVTPLLPTKWRAADKRDPRLLAIDKSYSIASLWEDDSMLFWNKTYTKYRRKT